MVLMLKRKPDDDTYPNLWDCLGGHFESGESAEECMTREAREESGLSVELVKTGTLIEYTDGYGRSIAVPSCLGLRSGPGASSPSTLSVEVGAAQLPSDGSARSRHWNVRLSSSAFGRVIALRA